MTSRARIGTAMQPMMLPTTTLGDGPLLADDWGIGDGELIELEVVKIGADTDVEDAVEVIDGVANTC
ncbi:hypothetical protein PG997_007551 [Apiospora hydei]|uniref:Uncharacterized protein n=1 Tax=Apiospora hydei TaxID=1337664 RepID=A0ABR1W8C8_9PEZI